MLVVGVVAGPLDCKKKSLDKATLGDEHGDAAVAVDVAVFIVSVDGVTGKLELDCDCCS